MSMSRSYETAAVRSAGHHTWFGALRDELREIAWLLSLTATLSLVSVGFAVVVALSL
jgi:hypothetical protein